MKILHWVRNENSGLFRTTVELAKYEERAGHKVSLRIPASNEIIYGFSDDDFDIHCIHSQIHLNWRKDNKPKILFLHGEPDYGMLHKVSAHAVMDLLPHVDATIAFNEKEAKIWDSFKRTYVITKGIDLDRYKPTEYGKKFVGEPSVLYAEHWRQFRHPLHSLVALEIARKTLPKLRFYAFGCPPGDKDFWLRILRQNQYNVFTPGVFRPQSDVNQLLNLTDIVLSPVFPSYGRVSLEAKACNKPVVAYDTNPHADYTCPPYDPEALAECVIKCWEEKPNGQRKYADENLSAEKMAKEAVEIYRRFV